MINLFDCNFDTFDILPGWIG